MAPDLPDWTTAVQVTVTVNNVPIVPAETTEVAAGDVGRHNGTDQTYQEVAKWTISTDKIGELKEIVLLSDNYEKTYWKVTIGSVTFAEDWIVMAAIPLVFADLKLAAAAVVKVEAKSTDGTEITVDVEICGKEIG